MSLDSVGTAVDLLPLTLPAAIFTRAVVEEPATAGGNFKSLEEPVTPKSENSILKPSLVCPPAPRKTRPALRKPLAKLKPTRFYPVPEDLSSVFIKLPVADRSKKRIRLF